jgi:hypothetical protein
MQREARARRNSLTWGSGPGNIQALGSVPSQRLKTTPRGGAGSTRGRACGPKRDRARSRTNRWGNSDRAPQATRLRQPEPHSDREERHTGPLRGRQRRAREGGHERGQLIRLRHGQGSATGQSTWSRQGQSPPGLAPCGLNTSGQSTKPSKAVWSPLRTIVKSAAPFPSVSPATSVRLPSTLTVS